MSGVTEVVVIAPGAPETPVAVVSSGVTEVAVSVAGVAATPVAITTGPVTQMATVVMDGAPATPVVVFVGVSVRGAPGLCTVFIGDAPPPNPVSGALWWDSVSGNLFLWYAAPNNVWVSAMSYT